jgi:ribulose-bisphosphate carboxylase small chain
MFDLEDAKGVMIELEECRKVHPDAYIRINAFDSTRGWETVRTAFLVNRPKSEPSLALVRAEARGRHQAYGWRLSR